MTFHNRPTHDRIEAVCAEFRHKLLDAFQTAIRDYEYLYPKNVPQNLILTDVNNFYRGFRDMITTLVIEPYMTEKQKEWFDDTRHNHML